MILTGNVALESMGFKTFGFAGGREDIWEPGRGRPLGRRAQVARRPALHRRPRPGEPLAAVQMGSSTSIRKARTALAPTRSPPPATSAKPLPAWRWTTRETVALIAGGHAPSARPTAPVTPARSALKPEAAESAGKAWPLEPAPHGRGKGRRHHQQPGSRGRPPLPAGATTSSGTSSGFEWEPPEPGRRPPMKPPARAGAGTVARRPRPDRRHAPAMLTTDLALASIRPTSGIS